MGGNEEGTARKKGRRDKKKLLAVQLTCPRLILDSIRFGEAAPALDYFMAALHSWMGSYWLDWRPFRWWIVKCSDGREGGGEKKRRKEFRRESRPPRPGARCESAIVSMTAGLFIWRVEWARICPSASVYVALAECLCWWRDGLLVYISTRLWSVCLCVCLVVVTFGLMNRWRNNNTTTTAAAAAATAATAPGKRRIKGKSGCRFSGPSGRFRSLRSRRAEKRGRGAEWGKKEVEERKTR